MPGPLPGVEADSARAPPARERPRDPERQELEQRVRLRPARDADEDDDCHCERGQDGPERSARERGGAERGRRPEQRRHRVGKRREIRQERAQRHAPDADRLCEHDGEDDVRCAGGDESARDLALPRPGDQELGDEVERLVHEQNECEQRQHGRALAVALADPALDQKVGNEQERQREHDRGGRSATQAGEQ